MTSTAAKRFFIRAQATGTPSYDGTFAATQTDPHAVSFGVAVFGAGTEANAALWQLDDSRHLVVTTGTYTGLLTGSSNSPDGTDLMFLGPVPDYPASCVVNNSLYLYCTSKSKTMNSLTLTGNPSPKNHDLNPGTWLLSTTQAAADAAFEPYVIVQ